LPEIICHITTDASVVLNKDKYAIERLISEAMAHDIAVSVRVFLAVAARAIKYHQLFSLVEDLVFCVGMSG
jgi:hypothetical protein